jgi:hypothetical protein
MKYGNNQNEENSLNPLSFSFDEKSSGIDRRLDGCSRTEEKEFLFNSLSFLTVTIKKSHYSQ